MLRELQVHLLMELNYHLMPSKQRSVFLLIADVPFFSFYFHLEVGVFVDCWLSSDPLRQEVAGPSQPEEKLSAGDVLNSDISLDNWPPFDIPDKIMRQIKATPMASDSNLGFLY